jgi:hypothetical protein
MGSRKVPDEPHALNYLTLEIDCHKPVQIHLHLMVLGSSGPLMRWVWRHREGRAASFLRAWSPLHRYQPLPCPHPSFLPGCSHSPSSPFCHSHRISPASVTISNLSDIVSLHLIIPQSLGITTNSMGSPFARRWVPVSNTMAFYASGLCPWSGDPRKILSQER